MEYQKKKNKLKKKNILLLKSFNNFSDFSLHYLRERLYNHGLKNKQYKILFKLLYIFKMELNIPIFFLFNKLIQNIVPFLQLKKIKKKKGKKDFYKVHYLSFIQGLKLAINWLIKYLKKSSNIDIFFDLLISELHLNYFKRGKIYIRKYDEYKLCSKNRSIYR